MWASKNKEAVAGAAATFGGRQLLWEAVYNTSHDVLIIGRDGGRKITEDGEEETALHPGYLKPSMCVADLTSGLNPSKFLREAMTRKCGVVSPRRLLVEQVRETVKRLSGTEIAAEPLEETLTGWIGDGEEE